MPNLSPLELAGRLAIVLALAFFLGLAFEDIYKRSERSHPGGVRTFPMLAIAGTMLYLIEPRYAAPFVAGLLALGLWLHGYVRSAAAAESPTLMIPASSLLAYLIGPIALTQPLWVAVAATVAGVLILTARERLHGLVHLIPGEEVLTAGQFLVLVGIILPLVPDQPVTTLTPVTPYHVWLAVVAICTLSYASYLLQRYAPMREGALLPAILGGLYSSTATTVVLARREGQSGGASAELAAAIVVATAVMYLRLDVVIGIFNRALALSLAPALAILAVIGGALAWHEWRRGGDRGGASLAIPAVNPLQVATAVVFAILFVVISVASAWVRGTFGAAGVFALAAIVGATDIDPFVLSIAQGGVAGMSTAALAAAILIAASSNNIVKAIYAASFGGWRAARRPAIMLLLLAAGGFVAAAVYAVGGGG